MRMIDGRQIDVEKVDRPDPAASGDIDETERDFGDDLDADGNGEDDEERSEDETAPIGPDDIETGEENAALDDKETSDGLDELDESVRHAAEDTVTEDDPDSIESLPVFERGMLPPKV